MKIAAERERIPENQDLLETGDEGPWLRAAVTSPHF
jgi:hypothetical protein